MFRCCSLFTNNNRTVTLLAFHVLFHQKEVSLPNLYRLSWNLTSDKHSFFAHTSVTFATYSIKRDGYHYTNLLLERGKKFSYANTPWHFSCYFLPIKRLIWLLATGTGWNDESFQRKTTFSQTLQGKSNFCKSSKYLVIDKFQAKHIFFKPLP